MTSTNPVVQSALNASAANFGDPKAIIRIFEELNGKMEALRIKMEGLKQQDKAIKWRRSNLAQMAKGVEFTPEQKKECDRLWNEILRNSPFGSI